jgi:hypothetical protein
MDAMSLQVPWVSIMVHYQIPRPWMYEFMVGGNFLINNCRFLICEVEGKQAKMLNFE